MTPPKAATAPQERGTGIGNTVGRVQGQPPPGTADASAANPVVTAEKPNQQGWLANGARYYTDNISPSVHDFAADAMNVGGKVATAGGMTMAAGGAVLLTGVGAPVAVAMEVGGAAATAIGGGVGTVGASTELIASITDKGAEYVLTGKLSNLGDLAWGLAKSVVLDRVTKYIPGLKGSANNAVKDSGHKRNKRISDDEMSGMKVNTSNPKGSGDKRKGKGDLADVREAARRTGIPKDRENEFSEFLHAEKAGGRGGTLNARKDFNPGELMKKATEFKDSLGKG